jgi:hypothetical protein
MTRRMWVGVAASMMLATPAMAEMAVSAFLAKADALAAKGIFAMGSPDIALLKNEVKSASTAFRAEQDAALSAGKRPSACLPPKGTVVMNADDLMAYFRTIPSAQASKTSVKTGFYSLMRRKYPCKG